MCKLLFLVIALMALPTLSAQAAELWSYSFDTGKVAIKNKVALTAGNLYAQVATSKSSKLTLSANMRADPTKEIVALVWRRNW